MHANHGLRRPFRLLVITNETAQGDELCRRRRGLREFPRKQLN